MIARTFFEDRLPRALAAAPELFHFGLVYRVTIGTGTHQTGANGTDGAWTLDLRESPRCAPAADATQAGVDCDIAIDATDFARLLDDPGLARSLFQAGRIRVGGRFQAALWFPGLLRIARHADVPGGMAALLGPSMSLPRFLEQWPDALAVASGPVSRLPDIEALPPLSSVDALLDVWPGRVRLADAHGGRLVTPAEARALYRTGHHLAFGEVQRVCPLLDGWIERLRWELDLPISAYGRCHVYASPDGAGEGLHFDENVNFVLQLGGAKVWRVAPNAHVTRPTTRFTTADGRVSTELDSYLEAPLPHRLPADAQAVRLVRGTLLVMPRGYWHETTAEGDSLSLNFTFDQPTWADVAGPAHAATLKRDVRWRELARGAGSPHPAAAQRAAARLQALLDATPAVTGLSAEEALARLTPVDSVDHGLFADAPGELRPA